MQSCSMPCLENWYTGENMKCKIKFKSELEDVMVDQKYFYAQKQSSLCKAIWNDGTFTRESLIEIGEELIRMAKED